MGNYCDQQCSGFRIRYSLTPYMKLGQNGIVSFSIRLDACGQRPRLYETTWNDE